MGWWISYFVHQWSCTLFHQHDALQAKIWASRKRCHFGGRSMLWVPNEQLTARPSGVRIARTIEKLHWLTQATLGEAIDGCSGSVLPACQLLFSHWPTFSRGKSYLRPIARALWPKPTPGPERHRQASKRVYAHVSCLALSTSLAVREDVNR